ncbi:hypothetical protein M422DRAFT_42081 [Sphaerobolus stellatus SS14]|nr:hypothetical protein M422DRAFT_42081 [Sphaerobolus stellatus SS14]
MGNSQSSRPEPPSSVPAELEQDNDVPRRSNNAGDSIQSTAAALKNDEEGSVSGKAKRRMSKLNLPFRRNSAIIADGADASSSNKIVPPSPSRRRWQRFSSLKPRPVSSIAASSSLLPDTDLPHPTPGIDPDNSPSVRSEGKGKEREHVSEEIGGENDHVVTEEDGSSLPAAELPPLSREPIQELRDLQTAVQEKADEEPVLRVSERPLTPIPSSSHHAELSENLGSWLGRGRTPSQEQESASTSMASILNASHSQPSCVPESRPPVSSPRTGLRSRSLPNIPRPGAERVRGTNAQERRPITPSGTGTIVIVQGVVHTSDSASQRPSSRASRPVPRVTPSAPSLRTPRDMSSHPPSRASTPQSSRSRSRFSALTESFRNRSRPSAVGSTLRSPTPSLSPWSHGVGENNESQSEIESNRSLGLAPFDSDTTSTSTMTETSSSVAAVVSIDNMSSNTLPVASPTEPEIVGDRGLHSDSDLNSHSNQAHSDRGHIDDNNSESHDESSSEDENEAELSASSIEVLGTLLSVATAATAASLVSGSTEPLFSSGLAGGRRSSRSDGNGAGAQSETSSTQDGEARGTRIRSAWDTFRDRFSRSGRNRRTDVPREDNDVTEAQLMRQMAQALNLDLDSSPDAQQEIDSDVQSLDDRSEELDNASGDDQRSERSLAPEGSFERFLHNLQDDLRTALVEDYAARRARATAARTSQDTSSPAELHTNGVQPTPIPVATAETSADVPLTCAPESEDTMATEWAPEVIPGEETVMISQVDPAVLSTAQEESSTSSMAEPSQPSVQPANSDSPRPANLDLPPLRGAIPQPGDAPSQPPQARGVTGQPGAGINWWRLYRFPPMTMSTPSGTNAGTPGATAVPNSRSHSNPAAAASQSSPGISATREEVQSNASSDSPSGQQQVVPVIVVGLQSVPVNRSRGQNAASPSSPVTASPEETEETPVHDRPWPMRAATRALNRIGRRGEGESSTENSDNEGGGRRARSGGRTYLIFVIGGYYPPNHSLVTGADDMNSFEALWELAELIGQVKPPVATKEDIEKSGLTVFKASELVEYEKTDKVASNTVDNCLICLENYEAEDSLRLLKCRHAYHQDCIDKWLEQGRNNCPVCRTMGAQTGTDAPTSPPSSTEAHAQH